MTLVSHWVLEWLFDNWSFAEEWIEWKCAISSTLVLLYFVSFSANNYNGGGEGRRCCRQNRFDCKLWFELLSTSHMSIVITQNETMQHGVKDRNIQKSKEHRIVFAFFPFFMLKIKQTHCSQFDCDIMSSCEFIWTSWL